MSDGRFWAPQKSRTGEIVLGGKILSVKQLLKKVGDKIFACPEDRVTNYQMN